MPDSIIGATERANPHSPSRAEAPLLRSFLLHEQHFSQITSAALAALLPALLAGLLTALLLPALARLLGLLTGLLFGIILLLLAAHLRSPRSWPRTPTSGRAPSFLPRLILLNCGETAVSGGDRCGVRANCGRQAGRWSCAGDLPPVAHGRFRTDDPTKED